MKENRFKKFLSGVVSGEINRRVLIAILIFSTALTLFLTMFKLYSDYVREEEFIQIELESLKKYAVPILSRGLWLFDDEAVTTLMNGIEQLPSVQYLKVVDARGRLLYESGTAGKLSSPNISEPITYFNASRQETQNLGRLSIYADYAHLYDELIDRFFVTLYTQILETFISSFFILILVQRLVSRHLLSITTQLSDNEKPDDTAEFEKLEKITLDRKPHQDEIETLVDTINSYRYHIRENLRTIGETQAKFATEMLLRQQTKKDLDFKNTLIESLFDSLNRFVVVVDNEMNIVMLNKPLQEVLFDDDSVGKVYGRSAEEFIRLRINQEKNQLQNSLSILLSSTDQSVHTGYCQFLDNASFPSRVFCYPLKINSEKPASAIIIEDVTDARMQQQISYNATHDYLTGLYNRYQFDLEVQRIFARSESADSIGEWSVGILDIDIFSSINNLFGHIKGDAVLVQLSDYLRKTLIQNSIIARLGGDEFVFAVNVGLDETYKMCLQLLKKLDQHQFSFDGESFSVSASIGLARLDLKKDSLSSCLSIADRGCIRAKNLGGSRIEFVSEPSSAQEIEMNHADFRLIKSVRASIDNKELKLFSQKLVPVNENSGLPVRQEILIRQKKRNRYISGGEFISAFERARIAHLIDSYVFETLIADIRDNRLSIPHLNVNISPQSIYHRNVPKLMFSLTELCHSRGIGIAFEITENAISQDTINTTKILNEIRRIGGLVAIDDFGAGNASYGYLDNFPVDMIKIDGGLIRSLEPGGRIHAVVSSIQAIAASFGALTVAEHTESEAQWQILRDIGIHYSQGYLHDVPSRIVVNSS